MPFPTDVLHVVTVPPPMTDAEKAEGVSAPANYKDPAKIAEYIRDNAERAWLRLALDPWRCRVPMVTAWWSGDEVPVQYDLREIEGRHRLMTDLAHPVDRSAPIFMWGGSGLGRPALLAEFLRGPVSEGRNAAIERLTCQMQDPLIALAARGPFGASAPSLETIARIVGLPAPNPDLDAARVLASLEAGDGVASGWSISRCATLRAVVGRLHEAGVL